VVGVEGGDQPRSGLSPFRIRKTVPTAERKITDGKDGGQDGSYESTYLGGRETEIFELGETVEDDQ
jgi:hypothetical protein